MLGGTFDPVHCGHLALARSARSFLQLEQLLLVPAKLPPHRDTPHATEQQRLQMLQLAVADEQGLVVDDMELRRQGPSYSLLSVLQLQERLPATLPLLVLGWDSFVSLSSWHRWQELVSRSAFLVFARAGHQQELPAVLAGSLQPAEFPGRPGQYCCRRDPLPDVSSTAVRQRLASNQPVDTMLPPAVVEYIHAEGLYGVHGPALNQEDI